MAKYIANIDELPIDVANEILMLINNSDIFGIKQRDVTPEISGGPPDIFFYKLSLHNDKSITLYFNDVTVPTQVHPLLSRLRKLALEQQNEDYKLNKK